MKFVSLLLAALIAVSAGANAMPAESLLLESPDGKKRAVLTTEPCAMPEVANAPVPMFLARIQVDDQKYDGCWTPIPEGALIVTPEGRPTVGADLKLVEPPAKKGRYVT